MPLEGGYIDILLVINVLYVENVYDNAFFHCTKVVIFLHI